MTGQELQALRRAAGYKSQQSLAVVLKCSIGAVSKWEAGARRITPSREDHILRVLGVKPK